MIGLLLLLWGSEAMDAVNSYTSSKNVQAHKESIDAARSKVALLSEAIKL